MDKTTFALEDFKNIQDLIKFMDQKAGFVLVIYGFIVTAFIEVAKNITLTNPFMLKSHEMIYTLISFITGFALVCILIYQVYFIIFNVIGPKVASNYCEGEQCLFYFEHIAKMKKPRFKTEFQKLTEDNILNEILGQVYEVSIILNKKRENFCIVTKFLYGSIIILIIFALSSNLI